MDLKQIYFSTGPARLLDELGSVIRAAGYEVRNLEVSPHQPPVVIFWLKRRGLRVEEDARILQTLRQALASTGVPKKRTELTLGRNRRRTFVAFVWDPSLPPCPEIMTPPDPLSLLP
jgi:hypothetical protein